MNVHPKGKNTIHNQQQQQQPAGPPSFSNQQQPRPTTPYHPNFDDGSQKYPYAGAYVGGVGGAGPTQVPPRIPLVSGIAGPNPQIPGAPNTAVGGMPQGPPPGSFVGHTTLDMSKQTPPHHPAVHHPIPPGSLVNQSMAMAGAGHTGPIQGRPTQGNTQFNYRAPMRPNNMARPPMGSNAPTHPPNPTTVMPYPGQPMPQQPVVVFIGGDQNYQQPQFIQTPYPYYQTPAGNLPPGSVYNPRAPTQPYANFRPAPPYAAPYMQGTPAVYYPQQQQQQHQAQQAPQQNQQPATTQQAPQPVAMAPVTVAGLPPASQARGSTGTGRRVRSSAIPIVDPNTYLDVLTGEAVPPVPAATPTTASSAATATTTTVPSGSAPATAAATTTPAPSVEDTSTKPAPEAEPEKAGPTPAKAEEKKDVAAQQAAAEVPAAAASEPTKKADEQPAVEKLAQENGEVPATSESSAVLSSAPISSAPSPDANEAGRGNQKGGKRRKNSRTGSTPTPTSPLPPHSSEEARVPQAAVAAAASASTPAQTTTSSSEARAASQEKDAASAAPAPAAVPPAPAPVSEPETAPKAEVESKETPSSTSTVEAVPAEEKPVEKPSANVSIESVITNGDKQASSEQPSPSDASESTTTPSTDDGDASKTAKPTLRYSYKEDQWSPVNPEGKKAYDRTFLLELQHNPASQKKPEGLPNLEVVRDKNAVMKRPIAPGDVFTPPFVKIMPPKGLPKRNSQQGSRGDQGMGGMQQQQQPRREIKLMTSMARVERVEDPNVWKPKHAAKAKEGDSTKANTEELFKTVRGILNKLTPSKFEKLLNKIKSLDINTEERLCGVIKLFFEKAVDEPVFSSTYAKMCYDLSSKEVPSEANPSETTNFRKLLLNRCQREFEKDSSGLLDVEKKKKELEETKDEDKKKLLEEELEDLINKNRRRSLGNIRFIGELFKLKILSVKIMHQCIARLLNTPDDEESLEALCRLLSTIGKELEAPTQAQARSASISQTKDMMNGYFSQLDAIVNKRKVSNRIRFMIQDVMDLRRNNWKPRREDNNPKTIDQIHKDVMKEREEQERELNNPQYQGSMGSMSGQRDGRPGDRRGDRGDDRNRKGSRPGDDGWSMVNNPRGGTNKVDIKQLKIPKAPGDSDQGISLGPGGKGLALWGRGASGGMSQSMMGSTPSQESRGSNRYQLLEDSDSGMHEPSKAPFSGRSSLGGQPQRGHDYRTMPGATKSALFPPNGDRDRSIDSRTQPSGLGGRSRSQQSSRESSVTRPTRETPQPLQRAVSKEMLQGKASVTDDEVERKAKSVLGELFANESIENAVLDLKEWLHPATVARFISQCVGMELERNRIERRATGNLFKEMIKRKLFSLSDISNGFSEVLQCAEDFIVDVPKLWEYLAEMAEPIFEEGVVNFNFLGQLSVPLGSNATKFVAAILRELVKAQGGVAGAERIWSMSNAPLASVLPPGVDPNAFVDQNKDLDFVMKTPSSAYLEFQRNLQRFLSSSPQLTNDDICKWIDSQQLDRHSSAFIRALVTAVTESSIDGQSTESKLNHAKYKNWTEVLRRYVENLPDRELQLLFAVQALVTQRHHPKGLIQGIFEALYDSNVVSEEGFESWVASDDPAERDGKAVAMKSITSFLTWLKEADPESDQDADV